MEDPSRRLTPSGGDLRSVDAFYVLPGNESDAAVAGFWPQEPGSYYERTIVRPAAFALREQAGIVLVADLHRINWKYGTFALKLALLDSGCVAAHCIAAAGRYGLQVELKEGIVADPDLRNVLDLTSEYEAVTSILWFEKRAQES
ncbi:hypothetical protein ACAG24_024935 [Mycobacterium sp. pW049]|uniref:hypothetical protein n=1 Tax=[Mycobacterium] bulgaricum TaxID=3238985 RepID=UPI00351B0487